MNPILKNTQEAIYKKTLMLKPVIEKVVSAGQKVMYSENTRHFLFDQMKTGVSPESIGEGIAKLIGLLYSESKRTLPMEAMAPAAVILLTEALQFLEEAGAMKVSNEILAECTKATGSQIMQLFGATPEKIQGMVNQSQSKQAPKGIVSGAMTQ